MSELETASIDLIITSPPYWDLVDYKCPNQLGKGMTYEYFFKFLKKNLLECMRVLKEDSFAIFIVGDIKKPAKSYSCRPKTFSLQSDLIQYFTQHGINLSSHFIWNKTSVKKGEKRAVIYGSRCTFNGQEYHLPPFSYNDLSIEHILVFHKPGHLRKLPSIKERVQDECNRISRDDMSVWENTVWDINPSSSQDHPATFPEELVYRLVKMYSLKGDVILDPFCGSGTTLKVALSQKRNTIGYEINPKYIEHFAHTFGLKKNGYKYHSSIKEPQ